MLKTIFCRVVFFIGLAIYPASEALAQHCQPYWTAAYKCAMGCGPCGGGGAPRTNTAPTAPAPPPGEAEARDLDQKGVDAYNSGNYESAADLFQKALDKLPSNSTIQEHLQKAKDQIAYQLALKKQKQDEEFNRNKQQALGQLKGISNGGDFESGSGLKGVSSTDSGLKGSGDPPALGLKGINESPIEVEKNKEAERIASLPDNYKKYISEADHIVVPPPSWEGMLEQKVKEMRIGQNGDKYLMLLSDMLVDAFDVQVIPKTPQEKALIAGFKVLVIAAKSTIAAQDEAEVIVFKRDATYQRVLDLLKDKTRGPQLIAALRSIKENKAPPSGVSEEIMNLARLSQNSNSGFSDVHFAMSAMLSKEARAAFFETAKMEGIEELNGEIRGVIGTTVQNRFKALRYANEQVEIGERFIEQNRTANPWMTQIFEKRVERIEKQMRPFEAIPEGISGFLETYEKFKESEVENKP